MQEEQAAIVELQQQSSDQQEAIQELYAAAYQELRTYSAELDDAKSSESALVDEINNKADAINDLIRQAKEEEIAAQKKAEEEATAAAAQQAAAEAEAEAARKQAAEAEAARAAAAEAANAAAKADTDTSSNSGSSSSDSSASSTTTESPSASDTSSSSSSGTYLGRFKLTGYCSCSICTGQWSGGSTASGTTPTAGRTIAMGGVPFGTKLMINGQVYTVERPRNRLRPRRHLLQQPFRGAELRRAVCRCISAELRNKDKRYAGTELPAYLSLTFSETVILKEHQKGRKPV